MSLMNPSELIVPQLGEGLTEVLIRQLLKKPGDSIKRDEPIYVMETDKALVDAESPADGILQEWLVAADDVVAVGCPVARVSLAADGAVTTPGLPPGAMAQQPLSQPAASGRTAEPDHAATDRPNSPSPQPEIGANTAPAQPDYVESSLSPAQRALVFRLNRSARLAVPGNMGRAVDWQRLRDATVFFLDRHGLPLPELHAFAYCVAQAAKEHPKFRSTLLGNATVREYKHLTLGVAVARPGDDLVTAVLPDADRFGLPEFNVRLNRQMRRAWTRGDQAGGATQLLLSSLAAEGIMDAIPTLVAPAIATLFVGAAYQDQGKVVANLSLTFDHRLINGIAAARFLNGLDKEIDQLKAALIPD